MKKIFLGTIGISGLLLACNKELMTRDYTKVTLQLTADSIDIVGRTVYAYDNSFWDERWDADTVLVDTTKMRQKVVTNDKGIAVFENVEYQSPDAFRSEQTRPQSNFRFVTQYKIDDSLVQKVYTVLVTKGNEINTVFKIDQ